MARRVVLSSALTAAAVLVALAEMPGVGRARMQVGSQPNREKSSDDTTDGDTGAPDDDVGDE